MPGPEGKTEVCFSRQRNKKRVAATAHHGSPLACVPRSNHETHQVVHNEKWGSESVSEAAGARVASGELITSRQ